MKQTKIGFLIILTFFVGCAVSTVAKDFVVNPVAAGPSQGMWEYACIAAKYENSVGIASVHTDSFIQKLNYLGRKGWRLVAIEHGARKEDTKYCMEREYVSTRHEPPVEIH